MRLAMLARCGSARSLRRRAVAASCKQVLAQRMRAARRCVRSLCPRVDLRRLCATACRQHGCKRGLAVRRGFFLARSRIWRLWPVHGYFLRSDAATAAEYERPQSLPSKERTRTRSPQRQTLPPVHNDVSFVVHRARGLRRVGSRPSSNLILAQLRGGITAASVRTNRRAAVPQRYELID